MPAWGKSMDEEYIWNMAAFLQVLPTLDEGEYQAMVARSGGHSHGGGETKPHADGEGVPANHHDQATEAAGHRSEEHTSELQSLMRISYAVFCLKKKTNTNNYTLK